MLDKLNVINARLNLDTVPTSQEIDNTMVHPSGSQRSNYGSQRSSAVSKPTTSKRRGPPVRRSSSIAFGSQRGSQSVEVAPILYEGKVINTIHDLINGFKLDTYEEAKAKLDKEREMREIDDAPENSMPGAKDIDQDYFQMVQHYRPIGAYYEHSHGDKLLFMRNVDKIQYDLVDAHRERRQKQLEEELQKLAEDREAKNKVD